MYMIGSYENKHTVVQFQSDQPTRIYVPEVPEPNDSRPNLSKLTESKIRELDGLASRGVFEIVLKRYIPEDANILGNNFVIFISSLVENNG